ADCEHVLAISENEPEAKERRAAALKALTQLGDTALERNDFDEADRFYTLAGVKADKALELQTRRLQRDLELMQQRYDTRTKIAMRLGAVALFSLLLVGGLCGFQLGNGFPQL